MESRVAVLEQIARTTSAALERIERRLDSMDQRIDSMGRRIDGVVTDQHADFRWLVGIMLGGFGAMLGVMAHGFHWL
jgi:hypothetical protein